MPGIAVGVSLFGDVLSLIGANYESQWLYYMSHATFAFA